MARATSSSELSRRDFVEIENFEKDGSGDASWLILLVIYVRHGKAF